MRVLTTTTDTTMTGGSITLMDLEEKSANTPLLLEMHVRLHGEGLSLPPRMADPGGEFALSDRPTAREESRG
jgi:hypothetical protein